MPKLDFTTDWPRRNFDKVTSLSARQIEVDGKELIQVCSTQYLGIHWFEEVRARFSRLLAKVQACDWGSLGSNYLGGTHPSRIELEEQVAREIGEEAGLAFSSGWAANYSLMDILGQYYDVIISDIRNHNSIVHGLSRHKEKAHIKRADLNTEDIDSILEDVNFSTCAVIYPCLEGITGDIIEPMISQALRKRVLLVSDEAHSFGMIGSRGIEICTSVKPDLRIVGFSKALGGMGAIVCGALKSIDNLAQASAPWIFSTSVPPVIWEANSLFFHFALALQRERERTLALGTRFRKGMAEIGFFASGSLHVSSVSLSGGPLDPNDLEEALKKRGFFAKVSQYPTRPRAEPSMRISFNPWHTKNDVDRLIAAFEDSRQTLL